MANEIIMLLMSFVGLNYGNFDHIVVYDHILNKLYAISSRDYKSNNFDNYITITKTSNLQNKHRQTESQMRQICREFKKSLIEAEEARKEAEKQAKREAREAEKQAKLAEKAAAKEAAAVRNSAVKKYEHNNAIERDAA